MQITKCVYGYVYMAMYMAMYKCHAPSDPVEFGIVLHYGTRMSFGIVLHYGTRPVL